MVRTITFSFFFILLSITLIAQSNYVSINNPGFEKISSEGIASGWQCSGPEVSTDKINYVDGKTSIVINHKDWKQTVVISDEVNLIVGHIYKLSAHIKTESAVTDLYAQYPTPVAASVTMESFPFTNSPPSVGATKDWTKVEINFIATKSKDKVLLHFGYNGNAKGKAWFDEITLEEVTDISQFIPVETVRWFGHAYRYEDKGWIFVHIEGEPYKRGYQYGYLLADEIKMFTEKLAINWNSADPVRIWNESRFMVDATMLRKYDDEYLNEMKGIADGATKAGIKIFDRPIDFLDIVSINSSVDLDYMKDAMRVTPNPLTGKSFLANEDELEVKERLHKCSSFLANNSATKDGGIVFGQLFMWGGYTGYHWNVFVDVIPTEGNRLVYQTFPGGIHSGADFYINSAGIMLGETTVQQTPYNPEGTPQSNRIRKAAQYANNIDDVEKILTTKNNGMYTNDWMVADVKKNEIGILLLGTNKWKLWRSSNKDWYNGVEDYYWSDNNAKDLEVRKEYIANPDDAPYDYLFRPVNRDISFLNFYNQNKGKIDQTATFNLFNSSPVNRPHACDGKVTTSEMAARLVFFANYGKVTLREQFINENGRMPDLPNAYTKFSLGYAAFSPIYITEKLKEIKSKIVRDETPVVLNNNFTEVKDLYSVDKKSLWKGTVYSGKERDDWFVSSSAAYYNFLKQIPAKADDAYNYVHDELTELNYRLQYVISREGSIAPLNAKLVYDKYNNYQIPRIRGTYLLHQLRLLLGNKIFADVMNKIHTDFREKNITTENFIEAAEKISGKNLKEFVMQWLEREDTPSITFNSSVEKSGDKWNLKLEIDQNGKPYHFLTTVAIDLEKERLINTIEVSEKEQTIEIQLNEKPAKVTFNYGNDIPLETENYYTYQNFFDDFENAVIVYGTNQQIEANHTIALRYQKMVADRFTEVFQPIKKDSEIDEKELAEKDIIVLGGTSDNSLSNVLCEKYGIECGKYFFSWMNDLYTQNDDGLFVCFPNPFNKKKTVYMFLANSAQQLYQMTKKHQSMPAWALFKGDKIIKRGYHQEKNFVEQLSDKL
ncbi:MAG: hypothetical protein C4539_02625 [Ignavibacteriales bacterium]|nr:MAG: hypothetical protein C4539_02625 [Ignavibacteriales bacterium]